MLTDNVLEEGEEEQQECVIPITSVKLCVFYVLLCIDNKKKKKRKKRDIKPNEMEGV